MGFSNTQARTSGDSNSPTPDNRLVPTGGFFVQIQTSATLIASMTSAKSIASNFTVQLIGKGLALAMGLGIIAIMTRALGAEQFGEYTTAITYLQMFGVLVDFGLTLTLIVMISEDGIDEERIAGNFLGLRLLSGFLLFSLAPISILAFPFSSTVNQAVLIGALAYFFMGGATMLIGIFQKHQAMWRSALAELINRFVLLALVIIITLTAPTVQWMVAASVIANAAWLIAMIALARPLVRIRPQADWQLWKDIITRSWPIAISIAFNLLYLKGDILFLAYFREQTEVGLYGVAYRILDVLTVLPVMLMGLVLPSLVKAWSSKNVELFRSRVAKLFDVFMLAVVPIIIGAQLVATDLVHLIAGTEFTQAGPVLALLIIALLGVFLGALFGHLVVAINKQKPMTWGYVGVAIIAIAGYLWLIPDYGMYGAIWVTLVSEGLIALITYLVVRNVTGIRMNLTVTLKAIIASLLMAAAIMVIPLPHVILTVTLGVIVYAMALIALKATTISEIKTLVGKS